MSAALEATGLGKRYGRSWALRDCSLRVPAGHVVALVGPNGAGKTTLLHTAMGFLTPSEGHITLFGWSPHEQPTVVLPRVWASLGRNGPCTAASECASSWNSAAG